MSLNASLSTKKKQLKSQKKKLQLFQTWRHNESRMFGCLRTTKVNLTLQPLSDLRTFMKHPVQRIFPQNDVNKKL